MIIVNIIINGLVLLGKSKPETIDIPIKSGAFRLNMFPYTNPLTYAFPPMVFLWFSYGTPLDSRNPTSSAVAGRFHICCARPGGKALPLGAAGQPLRHKFGDVGMGSI